MRLKARGPLAAVICLAALAGCAAPAPERRPALAAGNQGASWEVVLPGGQTGPMLTAGEEYFRRDPAIITHAGESDLAALGLEDGRNSLADTGRLILLRRSDQVIYFRDRRGWEAGRTPERWW